MSDKPTQVTVARAKSLRRTCTSAESLLWAALRNGRLAGLKFRRQHPIGPFIADFYCHSAKLVVEIDGPVHEFRVERDRARTAFLQARGLRVVQFDHDEVIANVEGVFVAIGRECGVTPEAALVRDVATPPSPRPSPRGRGGNTRSAFTLVELLVAVAIIAIISSFALGAMYMAQEQAREAKTRSLLARINNQILSRYESLKTRRLPIDVTSGLDTSDSMYARKVAIRQLLARRRLQRMELPDKWADVAWDVPIYVSSTSPPYTSAYVFPTIPTPTNPRQTVAGSVWASWPVQTEQVLSVWHPATIPNPNTGADVVQDRTAMSNAYLNRYIQIRGQNPPYDRPTARFQGAECLYMILTTVTTDESVGSEQFHASEIGDVDNDGAPEFIDGWGNPIEFIRWPAGFISDVQPLDAFTATARTAIDANIANGDDPFIGVDLREHKPEFHDPFDPMGVDPWAFALVPLVYSAGPDGKQPDAYGLEIINPKNAANLKKEDLNDPYDRSNLAFDYFETDPPLWPAPPAPDEGNVADLGTGRMRGAPAPETPSGGPTTPHKKWRYHHEDNIHSHALTTP